LKSSYEFLSPAERKIASIIFQDPMKFTSYTITELAAVAGVSQGSIINFARRYSGGGFPLLKLQVAAESSKFEQKPFSTIEETDGVKDIFSKTASDVSQALKNTLSVNREETLKKVAQSILSASRVEIYGAFRSAVIAKDLYCQLTSMGISCVFSNDALQSTVSASALPKTALVIAISSNGKNRDVLAAVNQARANRVPIVCMTSNKNSPLAKISDEILITSSSGNSVVGNAIEIRVAQLILSDALCSYIKHIQKDDFVARFKLLGKIYQEYNVNE